VFAVCGSASSWIEENLLSSTGFVGRISYTLTLEELPSATAIASGNPKRGAGARQRVL
jgi:hypothetical protein